MSSKNTLLCGAVLLALAAAATAAPPAVNLDGSARGPAAPASTTRSAVKGATPDDIATAADADIARRNAPHPKLKATRENLKGDDAARVLQQQQTPSTYDRSMQMGDKDHTEQVTNLKVYIKK